MRVRTRGLSPVNMSTDAQDARDALDVHCRPPGRSCAPAGPALAHHASRRTVAPCSASPPRPIAPPASRRDAHGCESLGRPAAGGVMAKPTTGRVEHEPVPEPDPDQMATDTLMTSVFSGICLIVATVVLAGFGCAGTRRGRVARGPHRREDRRGRRARPRHGGHRMGAAPVRRPDPGPQRQPLPRRLDRVPRLTGDHRPDGLLPPGGDPAVLPPGSGLQRAASRQ